MIKIEELMTETGVRFGTSGIRGPVDEMTDRVCFAYVSAFMQTVGQGDKKVVLGHDLRPSSPAISRACAAAIENSGATVEFAGAVPTPAIAYYALKSGIPAIMVTGSHIPFDRNGIKFYGSKGEISKTEELEIAAAEIRDPGDVTKPTLNVVSAVLNTYMERYVRFFPSGFLSGQRIGLYEHSSVARDFLRELLCRFGAEVVSLGRTDAFVPVDTEAVSEEDQNQGRFWSQQHKLDAILSTDGDADRPLIGDDQGTWLRGDIVGLLCARFLDAHTVVTPVSSNTAIEKSGWFSNVFRTRIGSPYVIEGMENASSAGCENVVGFEANGGFLLGTSIEMAGKSLSALPTRDAVLPMLALLALARRQKITLSGLMAMLPRRFTASDRIKNFSTEISQKLLTHFAEDHKNIIDLLGSIGVGPVATLDRTDGLRITFASGEIVHFRPSGNAPELRCYVETDSPLRSTNLVKEALTRVSRLSM